MLMKDLERSLILATSLMALNLVVGFSVAVLAPPILTSTVAGGGAFLEIGLLLIVGGCLMARQPLENKGRYTEDGNISTAWRIALIGRQMLLAAFILFLYAAVLAVAGIVVLF
jgi:predicted phage tail protein